MASTASTASADSTDSTDSLASADSADSTAKSEANRGRFFVLEGLDGSGTTTQAGLLKEWFAGEGARYGKCAFTFEPTAGPAGSLARMALNHRLRLDKRTLALLFAADRTDHLFKGADNSQEPGILHYLEAGAHVVSDRYLLSSLAYQSLNLPVDWILEINSQVPLPDLTIYLDIAPEAAQERLNTGRQHKDLFEALETQKQIRNRYDEGIELLRSRGSRIIKIDGNKPAESVRDDVVSNLLPFLTR
jgi:dTMP kinase